MKKILLLIVFATFFSGLSAQQPTDDREAIIGVIKTLFDAYRAQDSSLVRPLFYPGATMASALIDKDGQPQFRRGDVQGFLNFLGTKSDQYYDERIYSYEVTIDGPLATAWTEYSFFRNQTFSHCGYNVFTFFKSADGWTIVNITDTRRFTDCKTD
ncbi:MAG TPA: nuclear transport factor 2 family protein [Saprospiraceae bacterium]|nr:nuclear transport factor 2 family protein [Saprospiraceae bacterium]HMP25683.1 nuclear transport factor 2 family protein [Saprospiraceae bacterium]